MLCSLVSVIVNGGSLSLADSLTVPVCVADPPADIELNRSEKENKKIPRPFLLLALSTFRVSCLFLWFLFPVSALSIALSCLMDEADRRRDSLPLSLSV